ncbi:ABC transporter ATP-binding protein [Methylobacterium radiotolerans]|jgi:ATP-binding cassette, subfamily B, bacterial|uniref:ABC transporter ATP-binding protein n=1 Tax=Methylobacterium TaxID=407 RepID=UPI0004173B9B|nr:MULTISPECIES: ABC transporter ATP-binding protein [Methylobacterium]GAN50901.1 putative ABC transporter protein [Methylobacterium sp. ME121]KTS06694.1 multidrug ABC transporter ATP-binding protein [Methylobacterium radiotolerans]KTS47392.1 multidrug ABC transporter ATP-binding protein [Methylobacterium radiotolerans]KZC02519.1 putative multidrug export ATP-binding/permease protein [Methylobacterium radiotolerans]MBN6820342.1 ABC transporter ATP-binding protein [Methylobacterium organophilum
MLKAFLAYYRPYRTLFLVDFGCAVLSGLLELGFPIAVKGFIDSLLPRQDWGLILLAAAALALVYVANAGLMVVVTYWGHVLGINIETTMRARAFDHLQKLSFRFYDGQKTGHLVARVTKDLEEIGEVAHHGPEDLFIAVMTLLGAFALMLYVHAPLALITAAILPLIAFVSIRYGGRMTRNWQAQYGRVGAFNARIEENVGGMRVVQAFANEPHERALFALDNARYRDTKLEAYRLMAAGLSINYLGLRLVQIAVLLGGAAFVVRGDLTPGGFVGFLLLVGVFYRPLEKIGAVVETYPKGVAGFRRYQELLATEPDITDRPEARAVGALRGDIRFEGVGFGYGPGRPVFSGLDLAVAAGETVAFVGPSGVGKTTLCALLPRFYEVEAGRITVDGLDIRDITLASLRRQIGIVQQDVFLFAGTIRENIAYGRLDATEAEIDAAARRARLGGLIDGLPEGLDTVVGERGVRLSGGQKQRIAIARVFLKNPPILILDEATSALDTETEREIQRALAELARGRTTLVIAHRLATVRDADRIVVLGEGGVVEEGRHAALLAAGGPYSRLHAAQFGRGASGAGVLAAE